MNRITLDDPRDYLIWRLGMGRTVELLDICIGSERKLGRGTLLVQKMLKEIPEDTAVVYAITRASNTVAHQFYESLGFRVIGRLHEFYRDGNTSEHAWVFGLDR